MNGNSCGKLVVRQAVWERQVWKFSAIQRQIPEWITRMTGVGPILVVQKLCL